jgi:UDP-N-acetyl-D-glucosamine dehydrogenase
MTATASAPAFIPAPSLAGSPAFHYDVGIVGLGYVGLPTALAFHAAGRRVLGL